MGRCAIAFVAFVTLSFAGPPARAALPDTVHLTDVTDHARIERMTDEFRDDLESVDSHATIKQCAHAVDVALDTQAGQEASFGAICTIDDQGTEKRWLMCDDWRVGKFHATDEFTPTTEAIGAFVYTYCAPGD